MSISANIIRELPEIIKIIKNVVIFNKQFRYYKNNQSLFFHDGKFNLQIPISLYLKTNFLQVFIQLNTNLFICRWTDFIEFFIYST